jgi:SAM-dependent methyltransferase
VNIPNSHAYEVSADFYDMHAPQNVSEMLDFWTFAVTHHAMRVVEEVLELAVGTGRFAIPLAQQGYRVTGTDFSNRMLQLCREKADAAGIAISLRNEPMQLLDEECRRDAIVAIIGAPAFLVTDAAIEALFVACMKALRPGGLLLLDVANSAEGLIVPWTGIRRSVFSDGDREMHRFLEVTPDLWRGVAKYNETAIIRRADATHSYQEEFELRMFTWAELRLLLKRAGFNQVTGYGEWTHRVPEQLPAPRLIAVCCKPAEVEKS